MMKKRHCGRQTKEKHSQQGQSFVEVIFLGNLNIFPLISSSRLLLSTWGFKPELPTCTTVGIKVLNSSESALNRWRTDVLVINGSLENPSKQQAY